MVDTVTINLDKENVVPNGVPQAESAEPEQPTEAYDPEAPYGRFGNGKPRKNPPKGDGSTPRRGRSKTGPTAYKDSRYYAAKLEPMLGGLAMVASGFSPLDGAIVAHSTPAIAMGWGKVAEIEPRVAKFIDGGGTASVWVEAILPTALMVLMIGAAHDMLPPALDGMVRGQVNALGEQVLAYQRQQKEQAGREHAEAV